MKISFMIAFALLLIFVIAEAHASYAVLSLNTTVNLNTNTSAYVTEVLKVAVSNISTSQYTTSRLALNLTLSNWQNIIGPELTQHIINPNGALYNFKFLPGPLISTNNGKVAYLQMNYYVSNITKLNITGPRRYQYTFNNKVFNFESAKSGVVLGPNTTLTIMLPKGSQIISVYPLPDSPALGFAQNYRNVTKLSWYENEPLSTFNLVFVVNESLQDEVINFFLSVYNFLGIYVYLIIILIIILFIIYIYFKIK
ncbi:MAG: hypothetical protein M1538_02380 [Candidatus Marsarchaeota archaeon]|jgi:hypothetical protein|nr:hypothetical protein [Candidatus Marsarchaeota archaeon]